MLGHVFTLKHLCSVHPLKASGMAGLFSDAASLERKSVVEIIDDSGADMTCRFIPIFAREAIYSTMMYQKQRKNMHLLAAEYLLNNTLKVGKSAEWQQMVIHLLAAEDTKERADLSSKSKKLVTIKQVTSALRQSANVFKAGRLQRLNSGKELEECFAVAYRNRLSFYRDEKEYKANNEQGTVYLKSVGACEQSGIREFVVSASGWVKKDVPQQHRRFYFAVQSAEERDEWITTIDMLRAAAIQSNFKSVFGIDLRMFGKKEEPQTMKVISKHIGSTKRTNKDHIMNAKANESLKANVKGMFNYALAHLVGHMIEHAYGNPRKISQTPLLVGQLGVLRSIEKKCTASNEPRHIHANEFVESTVVQAVPNIEEHKEVQEFSARADEQKSGEESGIVGRSDESVVQLEEEEVSLKVNSSLKTTSQPHKSVVHEEVNKSISSAEEMALNERKYDEGLEAIVPSSFREGRYTTESNGLHVKPKKEKSIAELQRLKSRRETPVQRTDESAISSDFLMKEMCKLLEENLKSPSGKRCNESLMSLSSPPGKASRVRKAKTASKFTKPPITKGFEAHKNRDDNRGAVHKHGLVTRDVTAIGGDIFTLKPNSTVVVERINAEDNIAVCTHNGLKGLFPLDSIKIGSALPH